MEKIRRPAVAGMFYPANPDELLRMISSFMTKAEIEDKYDHVFGVVSPHAGYTYSGLSAAYAFNVLKGSDFETAVVLSPSHQEYFPGISVYNGDAYNTPLGNLRVDTVKREKLISGSGLIFAGIEGHRGEHAVEVQLPFLQMVKNDAAIVPVVIGDQRKKYVDELAEKLTEIADDKTVVIASSDLSHFHSKDEADKLDSIVADRISSFEYDRLQNDLEMENCEACGGGGIVAMMKSAHMKNFNKSKVLSRSDSGDVSGDNESVVGYLSAVIYN